MSHRNGPERVWVNGEKLNEQWYHGPMRPAQHGKANDATTFRAGWNEILIKYARADSHPAAEAHLFLVHPGIGVDGRPSGHFNVAMVDVVMTHLPWEAPPTSLPQSAPRPMMVEKSG